MPRRKKNIREATMMIALNVRTYNLGTRSRPCPQPIYLNRDIPGATVQSLSLMGGCWNQGSLNQGSLNRGRLNQWSLNQGSKSKERKTSSKKVTVQQNINFTYPLFLWSKIELIFFFFFENFGTLFFSCPFNLQSCNSRAQNTKQPINYLVITCYTRNEKTSTSDSCKLVKLFLSSQYCANRTWFCFIVYEARGLNRISSFRDQDFHWFRRHFKLFLHGFQNSSTSLTLSNNFT